MLPMYNTRISGVKERGNCSTVSEACLFLRPSALSPVYLTLNEHTFFSYTLSETTLTTSADVRILLILGRDSDRVRLRKRKGSEER